MFLINNNLTSLNLSLNQNIITIIKRWQQRYNYKNINVLYLSNPPLHDYRIPRLTARKYGITRTGQNKKSTGKRHAHVEALFPYKGVSSQTRMSMHDRTWADVENQLRANFGTEEGEQDGETRWVSRPEKSKNVERWRSKGEAVFHSYAPFRWKSSPEGMHDTFETFFDTRRCLARLKKTMSLFRLGISRNRGYFGEENFCAILFCRWFWLNFQRIVIFAFFSVRNEFFLFYYLIGGKEWFWRFSKNIVF